MQFNLFKNASLRVIVQKAFGVVIGFLVALTTWAESSIEEDGDWVVDRQAESTGDLSVSIATEPAALVYGDVVDATIDVANGTNEDRQVVIKVLLGEAALFVRGDHEVKFVHPDQAENERLLAWPALLLPAGARGRVSFQFLVNWHSLSDYVYIQVEALDPAGAHPPVVIHLKQTPQYPPGDGGFLVEYGYMLVTVVLGAGLFYGVWRATCRMAEGESIASSLSGICMGLGGVLVVLFTTIICSEFVPWIGWKETNCTILDVRYSLDTSEMKSSQGPSSTVYHYSGCLALSFEGPSGPVIASGYRQQSSISGPEIMNEYRAGSETVCYYDPNSPARVVVERDPAVSGLMKELAFFVVGVLLFCFGYRRLKG